MEDHPCRCTRINEVRTTAFSDHCGEIFLLLYSQETGRKFPENNIHGSTCIHKSNLRIREVILVHRMIAD